MTHFIRFPLAALLAATLFSSAQAQFTRYDPSRDQIRFQDDRRRERDPYAGLQSPRRRASLTSVPAEPTPRYQPQYASPFYPYPGYFGYAYRNPFEGYLTGIANAINAQGQYGIDYQTARLQNQSVEQEKIRTRRMLIEQRLYEQSLRPTENQLREYHQREAERRALNAPPITEILDGTSLNVLLTSIKRKHGQNVYGPSIPLSADVLRDVNVTGGAGGHVGVFRDGAAMAWPVALRDEAFDDDRKRIDQLVQLATMQGKRGSIEVPTIKGLSETVRHLEDVLRAEGQDLPLGDYASAKRFVQELKQGLRAIKDPKAANYFNHQWSAQGRTVDALVDYMAKNGLTFAAAVSGNESAYRSLQESMASYELALNAILARSGGAPTRP